MIKLKQAVIVEGKYDKIRLSNILDATIITTDGFRIFKDTQKRGLIRLLAEKCGIIIMTDSDHAGQMIRRHICDFVKNGEITNIYLPQLQGKERRKAKAGAEGLLGVEGTDDDLILKQLEKAGLIHAQTSYKGKAVTKTDLFIAGISGGESSTKKRESFCRFMNLPSLPANTLLDALNTLYSYDEFWEGIKEWNREETEN